MNENSVETLVYKYNPNANWIIVVYGICLFWFFYSIPSLGSGEIILLAVILIIAPLYVRFAKQSILKVRTWDERKLIFSSNGIEFGDDNYPVDGLEAAAIYLESFNGFEYRELGPTLNTQHVYVKAEGDKNTISVRYKGEVTDFTFYLASYDQFCTFRAVLNDWTRSGVNVVLKQVFDDDFIIQEMAYYNTPSGLMS